MRHMAGKCCLAICLATAATIFAPVFLLAQQTSSPAVPPTTTSSATNSPESSKALDEKLAQLDQRVTAAQSSADNAWMLVSAALVLMMTGPGLALFYGGLVRRKN